MPKDKNKYRTSKVDPERLQRLARELPGTDGSPTSLALPSCLRWLDEKLGKKAKASSRLQAVAESLTDAGFLATQHSLSSATDYERKLVSLCFGLDKRAHALLSSDGAGATASFGPHDVFALTEGRVKEALLVALEFESTAPPASTLMPPSYADAMASPPAYSVATGLPVFFAMYRSLGQKMRGLSFPHIYLFDPNDGEFKCKVRDAHDMFEALISAWGGPTSRIGKIKAWKIVANDDSWAYGEEDDDDDEERYVEASGWR